MESLQHPTSVPSHSQPRRQTWLARLLASPLLLYILLLTVLPVFAFLRFSFFRTSGFGMLPDFNFGNYGRVLTEETYRILALRSFVIGAATGIITVALAYPLAYVIAFRAGRRQNLLLFLVLLTMFTNYLIRVYAWRSILSTNGLLDTLLVSLHVTSEHRSYLLFTPFGTLLALVNAWLPLAVLPIYSALLNIPTSMVEVARDLGAKPAKSFRLVILPLSADGALVAFTLVFLLSTVDFVTPALVGGSSGAMIGSAIQTQFGENFNWPLGSALAFTVTVLMGLALAVIFAISRTVGLRATAR